MPARRRHRLLIALAAFAVALVLLALGAWIGGRHPDAAARARCARSSTGSEDRRVVNEALDLIESTYYRKIPRSQLADDAIAGAVAKLRDRFSNYFTPERVPALQGRAEQPLHGRRRERRAPTRKGLRVMRVFDGSPAAKRAGIVAGDVHRRRRRARSLAGVSSDVATSRVKGPEGTDVAPHGRARRQARGRVDGHAPARVASRSSRRGCARRAASKIGVVALSQFSSGAHAEVYAALQRAARSRAPTAFVLDLRGNGGGLVDEAQLIASAFLPTGRSSRRAGATCPSRRSTRPATRSIGKDADVVVLVDRGTASASEIVAGALQDRDRAKIVGTRTFGKGVFQEVIELSNGGALDITVGQYFTPKGRNLGGQGVSAGTGLQARRRGARTIRRPPPTRRCARRCDRGGCAASRPGEPARRAGGRGVRRPAPAATAGGRAARARRRADPNAPS